jgi:hypothetical protein
MAITKATASSIAPAAKGDLVVGSATNDAAVLGVGSNDQVLTADSSTATGLKWATPAAGAYTLLSTTTLSGTTTNITSISTSYKFLYVVYFGIYGTVDGNEVKIRFNNDSGSNYNVRKCRTDGTQIANNETGIVLTRLKTTSDAANMAVGTLLLPNYAASETKIWSNPGGGSASQGDFGIGTYASNTAISELNFYIGGAASYSGGTVRVYGVN